jgi:hypothetical protein
MAFEALFGATLLTKDGEKPTSEVLGGKTNVMIYFSAHWCPPWYVLRRPNNSPKKSWR